jgi:tetratricopeptide (TPR) repeat protein
VPPLAQIFSLSLSRNAIYLSHTTLGLTVLLVLKTDMSLKVCSGISFLGEDKFLSPRSLYDFTQSCPIQYPSFFYIPSHTNNNTENPENNMNEKMPNSGNKAAPNSAESWFDYVKTEFWPQHGTKVLVGLVLAAVAIFAIVQHLDSSAKKETAMTEELGKVLDYIYIGKSDSALATFESAVQNGTLKGLPLAKAALLSGNIYLQNSRLDSAEILYKLAAKNGSGVELISSAAEHGLAVVAMERDNYAEAISLLNDFVNKYGKRTGDLAKRYAKTEPVDVVPTVPDALWKLTLCYLEIKDVDKARQTAEKILKIYGDSPKAADASKLLATL